MAVVGKRTESVSKPKRYIVLPKGTYGALFRGYGSPELKDNFFKPGEKVEQFSIQFLLFCTSAGKPLEKMTAASKSITTGLFFDPVKGTQSNYFKFLAALYGRKMSAAELWQEPSAPDLDTLIAWPLSLSVEPKVGNDGIERNKVVTFGTPTDGIVDLARKIHPTITIQTSERDGHKYIASPKPEEAESDEPVVVENNGTSYDFDGLSEDDIPF